MVFVTIFNNENLRYEKRETKTKKQVEEFLETLTPEAVKKVTIFNPWTENVYMVRTEKYNFSFKFTIKQFKELGETFKRLNKGEEIEMKWY